MGLVDEVRKKLGLEPKRIKTETGNAPNEIKVNRAIHEFAGYPQPIAVPVTTSVVPSPGKTNIKDKRRIKFSVGFDSNLMNQDNENQLQRRQAQKQIKQSLEFAEDTYISQFPGDFGPSVATVPDSTKPNPTAAAPSVPPKRKKMQELFGPTTPGEHGSPKYGGDILGEFNPKNKKTSKKNVIKQEYDRVLHNDRGKLFELLHAKYMHPFEELSTHYRDEEGKSPKSIHDNIQSKISEEQYERIDRHARESAKKMKQHLREEGYDTDNITQVAWTSNGASDVKKFTGEEDPNNDSDVMYRFDDPETGEIAFAGASLKYASSKDPNIRNPGLGSLEESVGASNLISSFEKHKAKMRELGYTGTVKENHEKWKSEKTSERGRKAEQNKLQTCREIAKNIHGALKKKTSIQLENYIRDIVSPETRHPVYRLHSQISESHATYHIDNPILGIDSHLNQFSELLVDSVHSGGTSVVIRGRKKDSGEIYKVLDHNIKGVSGPHRGIVATTKIRGYERKASELKEESDIVEVDLVEHVQSIISEAKQIPDIKYAINHPDEIVRGHARKYKYHNTMMNQIIADQSLPDRDKKHAEHYKKLIVHHRQYKMRLSQLQDAKDKEQLQENRGADSKGLYRPTEQGAGLTRKGAKKFGVKTAVTTPPSKLDPKGKAAKRRKSFCARMSGMEGPMKDEKGRPTRKAMSLRRWNCEANELLMSLVEAKKMKGKDPCWDNYEMVGTKEKNGRTVPNCVPKD